VIRLPFRRRSPAASAYSKAKSPPASTPWREAAFVVADLELTGLDPRRDEIISFAAVPVDAGRIVAGNVRAGVVRPERMPSAETVRIHGLRPADLAEAPPLAEVLEPILETLTGRVLVAHPAWVEREFLSVVLRTAGVRLKVPVICTATLAARVVADRSDARETGIPLSEAAQALGLPVHAPHTAEGDALTTAQLFIALATRLDRREPQTVGSLARLSGQARA
jgi:DNA polymerase III subunit epsilon